MGTWGGGLLNGSLVVLDDLGVLAAMEAPCPMVSHIHVLTVGNVWHSRQTFLTEADNVCAGALKQSAVSYEFRAAGGCYCALAAAHVRSRGGMFTKRKCDLISNCSVKCCGCNLIGLLWTLASSPLPCRSRTHPRLALVFWLVSLETIQAFQLSL